MKVDLDPMQMEEAHYAGPIEILMVKGVDGSNMDVDKEEHISLIVDSNFQEVYPQYEEGLIDFLERFKLNDSKTMVCPYCSVMFDEEATKKVESSWRVNPIHGWGGGQTFRFFINNGANFIRTKSRFGSFSSLDRKHSGHL